MTLWPQKMLALKGTTSLHVPLCPHSLLLQCFPFTGTLFESFLCDTLYFSETVEITVNQVFKNTDICVRAQPGMWYRAHHESYYYFIQMCLFPSPYCKLHEIGVTIP